jgi:hypothetical protein
MHAAKIPMREVQGEGLFQVRQFLRVCVCQATDSHTQLAIAGLDQRCAEVAAVGPPVPYFYYRLNHRRRRVPSCRVMLTVWPPNIFITWCRSCQHIFHAFAVESEAVRGQLNAVLFDNPSRLQLG